MSDFQQFPLDDQERGHVSRSWSHFFAHLIAAKECYEAGEFAMSAAHLLDLHHLCETFGRRLVNADDEGSVMAAQLKDEGMLCDEANDAFRGARGRIPD